MGSNTAGGVGRQLPWQVVPFLRKSISYTDDGSTLTVGWVPAGAVIDNAYVIVSTAFNAGTTNVLDIGTAADTDGFATDLALGTIGKIAADELATSNDLGPFSVDTEIQCVVDLTGTAATAGAGEVIVTFIPDIDG